MSLCLTSAYRISRRSRPFATSGLAAAVLLFAAPPAAAQAPDLSPFQDEVDRIIQAATTSDFAWQRLAFMLDTFGPRFSGSLELERALDWILEEMEADGLDNVRGEPVMVPRWVRGEESLRLVTPYRVDMPMLSLGGSVATPPGGIDGEVIVVGSFEELEARAEEARGRVVLFNVPFTSYGETVQYRSQGAIAAARAGAVASMIRSVGPFGMQTPHTGGMAYAEGVPRIPHVAITLEHAELLQRMVDRGQRVEVHLEMEARTFPDVPSRNAVAELVGREHPEQIIVLGGHIDSWDVGQGAMDDGGGSVAAWEAVRLLHELGLRPRRTVRVALWTNEENGLRGANAYRDQHLEELDDHVLALESDAGVFSPLGFGFTGSDRAFEIVQAIGRMLEPIGADRITRGGGGADIGPIMREGVPGMGLQVDGTRYFWYHHTHADTFDKLDRDEFNRCVAAMAVMIYLVAEMEERLPR